MAIDITRIGTIDKKVFMESAIEKYCEGLSEKMQVLLKNSMNELIKRAGTGELPPLQALLTIEVICRLDEKNIESIIITENIDDISKIKNIKLDSGLSLEKMYNLLDGVSKKDQDALIDSMVNLLISFLNNGHSKNVNILSITSNIGRSPTMPLVPNLMIDIIYKDGE